MKKLITILMFVFLIGLVSAIEPHQQNTDLELSYTSNKGIECNLTTINTPVETISIYQTADRNGQTFDNKILGGNFSQLGIYTMNIVCYDGTDYATGSVQRDVTATGSGEISIALVLILFLGSLIFGFLSWFFSRDMFLHILFLFTSMLILLYAINYLHIPMLFFTATVVVVIAFVYYMINYIRDIMTSFKRKRGFEF